MRRVNKTSLSSRTSVLLRGNEGTSLVLVSIIAIIVITAVIVLRISTSALWASADKQLNQDRAYEVATSLATSMDYMITSENAHAPADYVTGGPVPVSGLPDATVDVTMTTTTTSGTDYYVLSVTAKVAGAEYTYTATYYANVVAGTTTYKRAY